MALFSSNFRRNKPTAPRGWPASECCCSRDKVPELCSQQPSQLALLLTGGGGGGSFLHSPKISKRSLLGSPPHLSKPLHPIYSFLWLEFSSHSKTLRASLVFFFFFITVVPSVSNRRPCCLHTLCHLLSRRQPLMHLFVFKSQKTTLLPFSSSCFKSW